MCVLACYIPTYFKNIEKISIRNLYQTPSTKCNIVPSDVTHIPYQTELEFYEIALLENENKFYGIYVRLYCISQQPIQVYKSFRFQHFI
jgi:hypothetical protein